MSEAAETSAGATTGLARPRPGLMELLPAFFMLGLSAAVYWGTSELRMWRGVTPGPRFFPVILACLGGLLAVVLLISQWRGSDAGVLDLPDRYGAGQVGSTIAALVVFVVGSPFLGMVPMVAIFALAMLLLVLHQRLLASLFATAIIALGIQLVFVQWLKVALPTPAFL